MSPRHDASLGSARTKRMIAVGSIVLTILLVGGSPSSTEAAPPSNDNFVNAQSLEGSNVSVTGTMAGSTLENGEPKIGAATGTVWFRWTASVSGHVSIDLGDHPMLLIAVYTGSTLGNLVEVGSSISPSPFRFPAEAGTSYRLVVATGGIPPDRFTLTVAMPPSPPNDDFANAETLAGLPVSTTGTVAGGTYELGEPDHGDSRGFASVWYSWIAPSTGDIRLDCSNGETAAVYTGTTVDSLTRIVDGSCRLDFTATAGVTYRIVIYQALGPGSTTFELKIRHYQPPANDSFANAKQLEGSNVSTSGTMADSTLENGGSFFGLASGSVWFKWTAPESGHVRVDIGDHLMRLVAVYTGDTLGSLVEVGSSPYSFAFAAKAGTTYSFALVTAGLSTDDYTLTVAMEPPPPNDSFYNAVALTGLPASATGTMAGATFEQGEPDHGDGGGFASVWYSWTAPSSAATRLEVCPSNGSESAAVYTGSSVENLTRVAEGSCRLNFMAAAGVTYWIAIYLAPGPEATAFELKLRAVRPPANDNFANAQTLSGADVSASGTMFDSTLESGDPFERTFATGNIWFKWMAPASGKVAIDVGGSSIHFVAVYRGSALSNLVEVSSGWSQSSIEFAAEAGTTYWFSIVTIGGPDEFTLTLALDAALPVRNTLRVAKEGTGEGSVTSSPAGIDCGSSCSADFDEGTVVVLTANPTPGSVFIGWSGAGCSGTGSCRVTVTSDEIVKANFSPGTRPGTGVRKAVIGRVLVRGAAKVRRGRKATFRVTVSNRGEAKATGVLLRVRGRGVDTRSNVGTILPGQTKSAKVPVRFKTTGKVKLMFRIGSFNAGRKTVRKTVLVTK